MPSSRKLQRYASLLMLSMDAQAAGDVERQDELLAEMDWLWLEMDDAGRAITDDLNRKIASWANGSRQWKTSILGSRMFSVALKPHSLVVQSLHLHQGWGQRPATRPVSVTERVVAARMVPGGLESRRVTAVFV